MGLYGKGQLAEDARARLAKENEAKLTVSEAQQLPFNGITMAHNVNSEEEVDKILETAVKAGAKLQVLFTYLFLYKIANFPFRISMFLILNSIHYNLGNFKN